MSSRAIHATLSRSTSACSSWSSLSASWAAVILALSAIVVSPFVDPLNRPTIMSPAVAEVTSDPAVLLHHSLLLDRPGTCPVEHLNLQPITPPSPQLIPFDTRVELAVERSQVSVPSSTLPTAGTRAIRDPHRPPLLRPDRAGGCRRPAGLPTRDAERRHSGEVTLAWASVYSLEPG
jgi:hypothetical protein